MTDTITIYPYNASHVKVDAEMHVLLGMNDHFKFRPKGYQFVPAYKNKIWSGFIELFNIRNRTLPLGLIPRLITYAENIDAEVDLSKYIDKSSNEKVTYEEVEKFIDTLDIHAGNEKITPHDYQVDAVFQAITSGRLVALAPTSAGKSLILYIYMNWFMQNPENKILLIVPSVSLVHQMIGDFKDYSSSNTSNIEDNIHLILSGKEKYSNKQVTISTWQSLQGFAKDKTSDFLEQFDIVMIDECHGLKGKVVSLILDRCTNAYIRLGVTGTLDGTDLMHIQLEGLLGPVYKVITTKELMDRGAVSQMDIKFLMLTYQDEIKKQCKDLTYQEEIDYLLTNQKRLNFTSNLAKNLKGNTLILVNFVEKHGKPLYNLIKSKVGENRKVFFIHGKVDGEDRNDIRSIVDKEEDAIIVASFGTMSTGVSIKRLHNVIFASPSKSQIRVLQSLGRGLRLGKGKTHCTLYDIGDDLSYKKHKNFALEHAIERIKMYNQQQFNYKLIKVDMT